MNENDAYKLLPQIILISVAFGLLLWIPVIIKRLIKNEKIFTKPEPEDPQVVKENSIFGIILFSVFAIIAFAMGQYISGGVFCLLIVLSIIVLKYYGKKLKQK